MKYLRRAYTLVSKLILGLSKRWHPLMFSITLLAGPVFVALIVGLFSLIGWLGKKPLILQLALLIVLAFSLVSALKQLFRKARPDTDYARSLKFSRYSFPSGHATVGLVVWYAIVLACFDLNLPFGVILGLTLLSPFIVLLIGVSRVYLGAHYLIDVLVGWGLGLMLITGFTVLVI